MDTSHLVHNVKHDGCDVLYHASGWGTDVEKIQDLLDHRQHVSTTNLRGFWSEREGGRREREKQQYIADIPFILQMLCF